MNKATMNKAGLLMLAASIVPRIFQVRPRTWIGLGVGLLVLLGLLVWAVIAVISALFGQAAEWVSTAPAGARGALEQVEQRVERVIPGVSQQVKEGLGQIAPEAQKQLGDWLPEARKLLEPVATGVPSAPVKSPEPGVVSGR